MEKDKFTIKDLDLFYGDFQALKKISMHIPEKEITAFIGPSGCGKSTLLKSLNRMNDLVEGCKITGTLLLDGEPINQMKNVNLLRKRVNLISLVWMPEYIICVRRPLRLATILAMM